MPTGESLTVWKFPFLPGNTVCLQMPAGARLLHVEEQHGNACIWALVNPTAPKETRCFRMAGTGHPINETADSLRHVGTWFMHDGNLVFHLFGII